MCRGVVKAGEDSGDPGSLEQPVLGRNREAPRTAWRFEDKSGVLTVALVVHGYRPVTPRGRRRCGCGVAGLKRRLKINEMFPGHQFLEANRK